MAQELPDDDISLASIFKKACSLHDELESYQGSTNDEKFQRTVKDVIEGFERSTRLVSTLGLFSPNEQFEDVQTSSIRYLLCPAFLSDTTMRISALENRLETIGLAKIYGADFLTRCKNYGITAENTGPEGVEGAAVAVASSGQASSSSASSRMQAMAAERQAKIDQERRKRDLEKRIKVLMERMESAGDSVDDEVERDLGKSLLHYWIIRTTSNIRIIDQEIPVLEHMAKMRRQGGGAMPESRLPAPEAERRPFKPVVITKEKIKAGVFGAGYPSLPTMSMDEFYQKECEPIVQEYEDKQEAERIHADRVKRGLEEDPAEAVVEDSDDDDDDGEKLQKQRAKDDWKDDHRRGYGNRHNRS